MSTWSSICRRRTQAASGAGCWRRWRSTVRMRDHRGALNAAPSHDLCFELCAVFAAQRTPRHKGFRDGVHDLHRAHYVLFKDPIQGMFAGPSRSFHLSRK